MNLLTAQNEKEANNLSENIEKLNFKRRELSQMLWDKIQSDPVLSNDTILICMPEHGRDESPNSLTDANGLSAYDHTSDDNSRRMFALIAGPQGVVNQDIVIGSTSSPIAK